MAIREYTRDDWQGLSGSECWDGIAGKQTEPLICDNFHEMLVTVDKNGVFLYPASKEGEEDSNGFVLAMDIPTQAIGWCLIVGLADSLQDLIDRQYPLLDWIRANGFEEC